MKWRRGHSPGVTMGGAWAVHACPSGTDHWAQALSTLNSSHPLPVPPAADSAQQTCGWSWKFIGVSIYFLFQTLGILTFIIQSPFVEPIRKDKFIYTEFIINKEIRHHYSVHMKQTQQWRRPSPVSAGTGQWTGKRTSGWWGGGTVGRGDQSPQLLMLC